MSLRLLVVDDNPDYRLLVRCALDGTDIEIAAEAATTADGIRSARSLQPDLILLDAVMHDDDALSSLQLLREAAPGAAIAVVASYAEHELWGRSSQTEGVAYLSKATPPGALHDELIRAAAASRAASDVLMSERQRFPSQLRSARDARRFASQILRTWGCENVKDAVLLLVSELVTNAVVHAHSDVEVVLRLRPERVRVEIVDATTEYVQRRDAASDDQSGRGMALTEALAVAWGVDTLVAGKSVWFEVPRGGVGAVAS